MGKKKKSTKSRRGLRLATLCVSTTMVLVLLGLVLLSVLTAHNLSDYVKENLTVTVMLSDNMSPQEAKVLKRNLLRRPYAKHIDYISKEQALKEQTEAMGSDPSEFLGVNPFVATLEVLLRSEYANRDSLVGIAKEIKREPRVSDVVYQEDLMNQVNENLSHVNLILLGLALLLAFISFSLINNTVRLSIYARRFTIHTEKLVGASWSFIRRPFLKNMVGIGVLAAVLACAVLGVICWAIYNFEPEITSIVTWRELALTGVCVLLCGIIINFTCSYFSMTHFLKMSAGDLYKI